MDLEKLKKEQIELAKKVVLKDSFKELKIIAGCDVAYFGNKIVAGIVMFEYNDLKVIEKVNELGEMKMPYKATFLFYRIAPVIVSAYNKLSKKPDLLLFPFNGVLHPRKLGAASQLGIVLDQSTLGISKNLLCGMVKEGKVYIENEFRGYRFESKEGARPLYISPGYKLSLETGLDVVKNTLKWPHKLPEPLHIAHRYANKTRDFLRDKDGKSE